jgi:MarR family transcriptional regulator for hemolysin
MRNYDPEQSIGFAIYEVYRLMRKDLHARIGEEGLTQAQWRALAHLSRQEGCNQATLAEQLEIKPITLTRLIDKLVKKGWVERRPDPHDRRAVRLYLTAEAQPTLSILLAKAMQTRARAMANVDKQETVMLMTVLKKMKANLSD